MTCGTIVAADKPVDSDGTTFTVAPDTAARASYNPSGNSGLVVTITNAVPGTYTIPGVVITNNSTIPLDVNVTATATSDTSGGKLDGSSYVDAAPLAAFKTAATVDPLAASGGATTAKDITITIPDGATQGATYSFIIQVTATQS
jgi:hypothetical protein